MFFCVWLKEIPNFRRKIVNSVCRLHPPASRVAYAPSTVETTSRHSSSVSDVDHYIINTKFLGFIFNIFSALISFCLWLYSTCGRWPLFQFLTLILYTVGRAPWTRDQLVSRSLPNPNRINANRYPCLEWNSNPRPQCSSGWRRIMP
jgi:hypothetical protein